MESVHVKEVDERYIMSLIQNYISTVNQPIPQVNVAQESQAHDEKLRVGDYIDQYAKTNELRAKHIRSIGTMYNMIRKNILIKEWKRY